MLVFTDPLGVGGVKEQAYGGGSREESLLEDR